MNAQANRPHRLERLESDALEIQYPSTDDEKALLSKLTLADLEAMDLQEDLSKVPSVVLACYCLMEREGNIREAMTMLNQPSLDESDRLLALALVWRRRHKLRQVLQ